MYLYFFQPTNENLILRLFSWAEKSQEPLQTYSTGLLAAAMEIQEIASCFRYLLFNCAFKEVEIFHILLFLLTFYP